MSHARRLEAKEAEISLLGAILLDNAALDRVLPIVKPEDFFAPRHAQVYRSMMALAERGDPIDWVSLSEDLDRQGHLEEIGGNEYLTELSDATATTINIEHHAQLVHDSAEIRRLVLACRTIADKAESGDYDETSQLFDEAQQIIYELGAQRDARGFMSMKTALKAAIERIQQAFESKSAITGTPTGFTDFDAKTAGLHAGDLLILAARPAMGKTALALNIAVNAARLGQGSVAIFSLEMPTVQLVSRILASEARIDGERMKSGALTDRDIDRLLQTVKSLNELSIHIDDTASLSVMEARSKCRRLAADRNIPPLKVVIIDYLQLMKGAPNSKSREQEISEISRALKGLAKELEVPVIALSQLNRGVESRPNKRPLLSDLRESGAIEQDADLIMFCYRDEYYNEDSEDKGIAEIIIGKHRSGSTGTVRLKFFNQWTRFDNLVHED